MDILSGFAAFKRSIGIRVGALYGVRGLLGEAIARP